MGVMRNKKGIEILGEETVGILVTVLSLLVLVGLGIVLYNFYSGGGEVAQAKGELDEIKIDFESVVESGESGKHLSLRSADWYLFSEEFGDLCAGAFCLCLCKKVDCSGEARACVDTERFVLIRNGREARVTQLPKPPAELGLEFVEGKVYPFRDGEAVTQGWIVAKTVTPLFFRFNTEWEWSPDLENWMDMDTLTVSGGKWKGRSPTSGNYEFIRNFMSPPSVRTSELEGVKGLEVRGASLSDGVLVIQK